MSKGHNANIFLELIMIIVSLYEFALGISEAWFVSPFLITMNLNINVIKFGDGLLLHVD